MSILHLSPFPLHRLLMPFKSSSNVWRHSRVDKGTWNHRALPKVVALLLRTFQLSHLYLIETYRGGFPPFMDEEFNMTMSNSWTLNGARSRAHLQESEWGAPGSETLLTRQARPETPACYSGARESEPSTVSGACDAV